MSARKKIDPLLELILRSAPKTPIPQQRVRVFNSGAKYLAPNPQIPQTPFPYVQSSYMNSTYVSNTN